MLWNAWRTFWERPADVLQLLGFLLCPTSGCGHIGQYCAGDCGLLRLGLHAYHHRPSWALVVPLEPGSAREGLFWSALRPLLPDSTAHYNHSNRRQFYLLSIFSRTRCPIQSHPVQRNPAPGELIGEFGLENRKLLYEHLLDFCTLQLSYGVICNKTMDSPRHFSPQWSREQPHERRYYIL